MMLTKIQKNMTRHRLTLKIATERYGAYLRALIAGQPNAALVEAREHMRNAVQAMRRKT